MSVLQYQRHTHEGGNESGMFCASHVPNVLAGHFCQTCPFRQVESIGPVIRYGDALQNASVGILLSGHPSWSRKH